MFKKIDDFISNRISHVIEATIARIYFGFPEKKIKVIGITGTDGKTTTTHAIYHILTTCGKKASMVSSVYASIAGNTADTGFHVTTPRGWYLYKYLRQAVNADSEFFVLETTSHALAQNRAWGIQFAVGVLTNITQEHSKEHVQFEDYVAAKARLLLSAKKSIVNKDAEIFPTIKNILESHHKSYSTYSLPDTSADFVWNNATKTSLVEDFNKQNMLAAIATCRSMGLAEEEIESAVASFTLPKGRMDIVHTGNFMVIIDFAHTPNSIHKVLEQIKKNYLKKSGRIIHVFGSASERDDIKRPLMGKASCEIADYIVLTEEDYRNESVQKICTEIAAGFNPQTHYEIEPDRQKAIRKAISMAKTNDIVVLTGKSHEKSLARNGKEVPWDEYVTVTNALKNVT